MREYGHLARCEESESRCFGGIFTPEIQGSRLLDLSDTYSGSLLSGEKKTEISVYIFIRLSLELGFSVFFALREELLKFSTECSFFARLEIHRAEMRTAPRELSQRSSTTFLLLFLLPPLSFRRLSSSILFASSFWVFSYLCSFCFTSPIRENVLEECCT